MWLKRLLKTSATGPAGGGGGDLGVAGDNVMGVGSGQGNLFEAPNREEIQKGYNAKRRRQQRRRLRRKREWRSSRDRQ